MSNNLPKRKQNRLECYDYSSNGAYFITICTSNYKPLFWDENGNLTEYGKIAEQAIIGIESHYSNVKLDKYVVMPNHLHIIFFIENDVHGYAIGISQIIGQMKRWVSAKAGISLWQRSFYDRVIRNHDEYLKIWQYIDENPLKWDLDHYYISDL